MDTKHDPGVASTASSPEEEREVPVPVLDLQRSFVFGRSEVEPPQTLHHDVLDEDAEQQEVPEPSPAESLSLRRTQMKYVTTRILKSSTLKYLYLEGNQISRIPPSLFTNLPNLLWLDLRNNQITSLPAEIGSHRCLKTLLLEGNPISELPPELGNVRTLRGLNLRDCPVRFPPRHIVDQGLQTILQYLRSSVVPGSGGRRRRSPPAALPAVEKLRLTELTELSELTELTELSELSELTELTELTGVTASGVDEEDELQRFRELKHRMILLDRAELGSVRRGGGDPKPRLLPVIQRKKAGIITELQLFDTRQRRRPEERRQAAMKELKDKQASLEQRRKSQEALDQWRTRQRKAPERKKQRHREEAETDSKPSEEDAGDAWTSECEEPRSSRDLERQIRARVEIMQERRRNPRGSVAERVAAAERDMEEMRRLQAQLLEMNRGGERSFTRLRFTDKLQGL